MSPDLPASAVEGGIHVVRLDPSATFPLRRSVLGRDPLADEIDPGLGPKAGYFGVVDGTAVVATGDVADRAIAPGERGIPVGAEWRVFGMTVDPRRRGRGLGSAVLEALLAHVAAHGGGTVGLFARDRARSLYERAGFTPVGKPRVDTVAGVQIAMVAEVRAAASD